MQTFTYIFLAFLLASTLVQLYLSLRQKQHVSTHRATVPAPFAGKISLEEHHKAADYTLAKGGLGRIDLLIGLVILLAWTSGSRMRNRIMLTE
jgi:STE24 endopeptidase